MATEALLTDLERALAYLKLRRPVSAEEAVELVNVLRNGAVHTLDPPNPPRRSSDDYLLALAESKRGVFVTGDQHLLALVGEFPICTARGAKGRTHDAMHLIGCQ